MVPQCLRHAVNGNFASVGGRNRTNPVSHFPFVAGAHHLFPSKASPRPLHGVGEHDHRFAYHGTIASIQFNLREFARGVKAIQPPAGEKGINGEKH